MPNTRWPIMTLWTASIGLSSIDSLPNSDPSAPSSLSLLLSLPLQFSHFSSSPHFWFAHFSPVTFWCQPLSVTPWPLSYKPEAETHRLNISFYWNFTHHPFPVFSIDNNVSEPFFKGSQDSCDRFKAECGSLGLNQGVFTFQSEEGHKNRLNRRQGVEVGDRQMFGQHFCWKAVTQFDWWLLVGWRQTRSPHTVSAGICLPHMPHLQPPPLAPSLLSPAPHSFNLPRAWERRSLQQTVNVNCHMDQDPGVTVAWPDEKGLYQIQT